MKMLDSLENMLKASNENSQKLQNNIKREKEKVERDLKYSEHDKVNIDFLLTMLGNGFIDEDYRFFISKRYGGKLDNYDNFYLNTLKCNLDPIYKDKINHLDLVVDEIQDYQWSHPSVLNNNILTYLFENNMSEQIDGFVNAIQNHFIENGKDDFVKQYIDSLPLQYSAFANDLLGKISKKSSFAPFFNENSESLFCRMLCNLSLDKVPERKIPLLNFLRTRKNFVEFIFEAAKKDDSLKIKLQKLDIEVESIVNYKDSVRTFIIDESLYKITKENLDYIFASNEDEKPYSYFDYMRGNVILRKKIINSSEINNFVKTILLTEKKMIISSEGIVSLLFNNYLESEMVDRIIERIDNESVDLVNLRFLRKKEIDILKDFPEGRNIAYNLIHYKKVKIDFSNTLYLFEYADENDFVQFLKENIDTIVDRMNKDEYVWSNYLNKFYAKIYSSDKVGTEIFIKISDALISENIDILDLVEIDKYVSLKRNEIILECFKRRDYGKIKKTSGKFFDVIYRNFNLFIEYFSDITWQCHRSWEENMSVLLKTGLGGYNENNLFGEYQLNVLMKMISPYNFSNIVGCWNSSGDTDVVSKILEKIFIKREKKNIIVIERFAVWLMEYGKKAVLEFLNSNSDSFNNLIYTKLKDSCDEWIHPVVMMASRKGIEASAIADSSYLPVHQYCRDVIEKLKSYIWDKQNAAALSVKNNLRDWLKSNDYSYEDLYNDLFVLGRNIYQAADGGAYDAIGLVENLNGDYFLSATAMGRNPILMGAVFEVYFNHEGNLRKALKAGYYDEVMKQLNNNPLVFSFIRESLKPYFDQGLLLYIPGQDDVVFDIMGECQGWLIKIKSIKCYGVEILISHGESNYYEPGKEFIGGGDIASLKRLIGNHLAIPPSHIKLNMPTQNVSRYKIDEFVKERSEIALAVNNRWQKSTDIQVTGSLINI